MFVGLMANYGTLICLCHLAMLTTVDGYNLDVSSAIFINGPQGSHFGKSVTPHLIFNSSTRVQIPTLLVGASFSNEFEVPKTGALFSCLVSDSQIEENCQQIPFLSPELERNVDNDCVGVVQASQGTPGGVAVACAEYRGGVSSCVLLTNDLIVNKVWNLCDDDDDYDDDDDDDDGYGNQYNRCPPGFTVFMDKNDLMIIGLPGYGDGKGLVISRSTTNLTIHSRFNISFDTLSRTYFGMSVSVSDKIVKNKLIYVIGAPKSSGVGEVFLVHVEDGGRFRVVVTLRGDQLASNFGYKVTAVDLNGDGQDEILVSAPTFYDSQSCGGAVYVYNSQDIVRRSKKPSTILSNKFFKFPDSYFSSMTSPNHHHHHDCHNSWFGSDMSSPGDIDQDGFDDVIVGAPYEGGGALYVYRGSKQGIVATPSQKISSISLFQSNIHSLGHTISSSRIDFDSNGFPDVVVGCYRSDVVVVLRSRPVVDLHASLSRDPVLLNVNCSSSEGDDNDDCFVLDVCLSYSIRSHDNAKESSKLELELTLEQERFEQRRRSQVYFKSKIYSTRVQKDDDNSAFKNVKIKYYKRRIRLISHKTSECFQVPVFVKDIDNTFSLSLQLKYKMISFSKLSPSISHTSASNFVYLNPILSEDTSKGHLHEVKLQRSCGDGRKCRSNLNVWGLMELSKDIYDTYLLKMNSVDEIKLYVQVRNLGEDAHNARLFVLADLPFIGFQGQHHCHPGSEMVTCDLGNPLPGGEETTVVLRFDVRGIDSENIDDINFVLIVNTTSIETDLDDDVDNIDVKIIEEVDVMLLGLSVPTEVFLIEDCLHEITHKYEIKNIGRNIAKDFIVAVDWPDQNMADYIHFQIIKIETEDRGHCFINNETFNQSDSRRHKRKVNSLSDFFKKYLSGPNKKGRTKSINCNASNSCLQLTCHFEELKVEQSFVLSIHWMVAYSSIHKFSSEFDRFEMKSVSRISRNDDIKMKLIDIENDKAEVTTLIFLDNSKNRRLKLPTWMLISSTCLGVMSLMIIISMLNRFGFFKRKKHKDKQFEEVLCNQLNQNVLLMKVLSYPTHSKNCFEAAEKI